MRACLEKTYASKERAFGSQLEMAQVFIKETAATNVFSFLCWLNMFVTAIQWATGFGQPPKTAFHVKLIWGEALSAKETHCYRETPTYVQLVHPCSLCLQPALCWNQTKQSLWTQSTHTCRYGPVCSCTGVFTPQLLGQHNFSCKSFFSCMTWYSSASSHIRLDFTFYIYPCVHEV